MYTASALLGGRGLGAKNGVTIVWTRADQNIPREEVHFSCTILYTRDFSNHSTLQNTSTLEMARARRGMLLQCDPSIRALIVQIDAQHNDIILEELDDTHLLVDPSKVEFIKHELNRLLSKNIYNPMEEEEEQ